MTVYNKSDFESRILQDSLPNQVKTALRDAVQSSAGAYTDLETVVATNTITAAESGTTFVLSAATEFVSTLPAPAAGLNYKFIVGAAPSGASYTVVTNASGNVIQGSVLVDGAAVPGADEDTITFADGAAAVGDWAEVVSDGTNWYVMGVGEATGAITLTQAS